MYLEFLGDSILPHSALFFYERYYVLYPYTMWQDLKAVILHKKLWKMDIDGVNYRVFERFL